MKKIFTFLCVLIVALSIAGCGGKSKTADERMEDKSIKVIQTALECSNDVAKKSCDIMRSVDLVPVTKMEVLKKDYNTWRTTAWGTNTVVVATKDKGITKVITHGKVLYEDGQVKMKATSFIPTQTEADKCKRRAERVVKERLKDPDSVKFNDRNRGVKKENGVFIAEGEYRAKNSFGAYVVEYYKVIIDKDFNVKSVETYR